MSRKYNREEAAETRRLISWYDGIARDYKTASAETVDAGKKAEILARMDEMRDRAQQLREKLRAMGWP